ncbi:hypothetical protein TWF788_000570 [Orbilia oligospora]|uniref:Uncharacterized protein n=1 Tax=Orbilia oligospora TaxID=2813651 RepID=A0A7C8PFX0_ORBOL|nr:hypothetical protein TWF788_000570 [Orbilia oligospora]
MMEVDSETKTPAPASLPDAVEISTLDSWIDQLLQCKQLAEADILRLCEKACPTTSSLFIDLFPPKIIPGWHERSYRRSQMCNLCVAR